MSLGKSQFKTQHTIWSMLAEIPHQGAFEKAHDIVLWRTHDTVMNKSILCSPPFWPLSKSCDHACSFFSPLHTHSPGVAQRNHSLPLSSSTGAEGCSTSWSRAPQQDMREGRLYSLFIFNCCFLRWSRNWNLSPSDNKPIFTVWPHNARLSLLLDDSASYLRFCGTNQLHIYSCSLMSVGH